jgi:hypothetical protein
VPSSLPLYGIGTAFAQNIDVRFPGYTGAFTVTSSNTSIATVAIAQGASGEGPDTLFTVTPNALGACTLTITGGGMTLTVNVTVNSTEITGQ